MSKRKPKYRVTSNTTGNYWVNCMHCDWQGTNDQCRRHAEATGHTVVYNREMSTEWEADNPPPGLEEVR